MLTVEEKISSYRNYRRLASNAAENGEMQHQIWPVFIDYCGMARFR